MRAEYRFRCPECAADVRVVGESIRRSILEEGCLVCSSPIDRSDFEPLEATGGPSR